MTPVKWPEFTKERLHEAIREYSGRDRRYGGINQINNINNEQES